MSVAIVTGSSGLVGSVAARRLASEGRRVVGMDNDMRASFFGPDATTRPIRDQLTNELSEFNHNELDIRDVQALNAVFSRYRGDISMVIHAAAQPSHDWASKDPVTDFQINAVGTLNLLECARQFSPDATFVFVSTNKVYGDRPNSLPLVEHDLRWELEPSHPYAAQGIDETMPVDACLHSLFGASKLAADVLVQEYGRYFGLNTVCFRCGCISGSAHRGTRLHGFLSYLVKCAATGCRYTILGYKGKQVRDNINATDLVSAFLAYAEAPRPGEIYNVGGGRAANVSVLEAISICEEVTGRPFQRVYDPEPRAGDHKWWIGDAAKFRSHYPKWKSTMNVRDTIEELFLGLQ